MPSKSLQRFVSAARTQAAAALANMYLLTPERLSPQEIFARISVNMPDRDPRAYEVADV